MFLRRILPLQAALLGLACALVSPAASAEKAGGATSSTKAQVKPASARKVAPKVTRKAPPKPASKEPTKPASTDAAVPSKTGKSEAARPSGASASHQVVERESRIEFDERMVRGQSAAGAIYLFQRSPSEFKSIVQVPDSFRPRTVALLSPRKGSP